MTTFTLNVPFEGQALSVYKAISDIYTHDVLSTDKITRTSDESITFTYVLTLGVFRLLLDGSCVNIDQDFENRVSLIEVNTKDRKGKGKINASIRLHVQDAKISSEIICDCDVTVKGLLARAELPIQKVLSDKLQLLIENLLEANKSVIVIDDLQELGTIDNDPTPEVVDLVDLETLNALFESGNIRETSTPKAHRPFWVSLLRFPVNLVLWPINIVRDIFKDKSQSEPVL